MKTKTLNSRESQDAMASATSTFHRLALAAVMLGTSLALTGCGNLNKDGMSTSAIPDDYRTRHPIMLSEVEHSLDVPIASGDHKLTNGLRDSIDEAVGPRARVVTRREIDFVRERGCDRPHAPRVVV